jgi:hypothetical protein
MRCSWCLLALVAACGPRGKPIDTTAPRVKSAQPFGTGVPVTSPAVIAFSEAMERTTLIRADDAERSDTVVLIETQLVTETKLAAVDNPPLSEDQRKWFVPATGALSVDGTVFTLRPEAPLKGDTGYTMVVSKKAGDASFNPLYVAVEGGEFANARFRQDFVTALAPDLTGPVPSLVVPAPAATSVPLNLRDVTLEFDEDVDGAAPSTVYLEGGPSLEDRVTAQDVETIGKRVTLRLDTAARTLGAAACRALCPDFTYHIAISPQVKDKAGNSVDPLAIQGLQFTTASCADESSPRADVAAIAVEVRGNSVTVRVPVDEPSTGRLEAAEDMASCFFQEPACVIAASASQCAGVDVCQLPSAPPYGCTHTFTLSGLNAHTTYRYQVIFTDAAGNAPRLVPDLSFTTGRATPKIAITELLADPKTPWADDTDEFIELYNHGDLPVDLDGWRLDDCRDEASCLSDAPKNTRTLIPFATGGAAVVPAGGYALVVRSGFVAWTGLPTGTVLLKAAGTSNMFSLLNSGAQPIGLFAPGDEGGPPLLVSTGVATPAPKEGQSIERKSAASSDEPTAWAYSTTEFPGSSNKCTPGAVNSVNTQ